MKLVGILDSPFVRRSAITMQFLGIDYEHVHQSVLAGYEEYRKINPIAKSPTLLLDDGEILIDSTMIIDYVESIARRSLMPDDIDARRRALQLIGVALAANEKCVQRMYELKVRPAEKQYEPWLARVTTQLQEALDWLESRTAALDTDWYFGDAPMQPDITVAVAWAFVNHIAADVAHMKERPALDALSKRAEALPEFRACPLV